jgi:hypothetical protein
MPPGCPGRIADTAGCSEGYNDGRYTQLNGHGTGEILRTEIILRTLKPRPRALCPIRARARHLGARSRRPEAYTSTLSGAVSAGSNPAEAAKWTFSTLEFSATSLTCTVAQPFAGLGDACAVLVPLRNHRYDPFRFGGEHETWAPSAAERPTTATAYDKGRRQRRSQCEAPVHLC